MARSTLILDDSITAWKREWRGLVIQNKKFCIATQMYEEKALKLYNFGQGLVLNSEYCHYKEYLDPESNDQPTQLHGIYDYIVNTVMPQLASEEVSDEHNTQSILEKERSSILRGIKISVDFRGNPRYEKPIVNKTIAAVCTKLGAEVVTIQEPEKDVPLLSYPDYDRVKEAGVNLIIVDDKARDSSIRLKRLINQLEKRDKVYVLKCSSIFEAFFQYPTMSRQALSHHLISSENYAQMLLQETNSDLEEEEVEEVSELEDVEEVSDLEDTEDMPDLEQDEEVSELGPEENDDSGSDMDIDVTLSIQAQDTLMRALFMN